MVLRSLALFACLAAALSAEVGYSPVLGASAHTIKGALPGSPPTPQFTFLSLTFVQSPVTGGTITAIGASSLTDGAATWTDDLYNNTHYVKLTSGAANGAMATITDTVAGTDTLSLSDNLAALGATVGDAYVVIPYATVNSLFGADNTFGFRAGTSTANADQVLIFNNDTKQYQTIFFSSNPGLPGWRNQAFQAVGGTIVLPEQGVGFKRTLEGDLSVVWHGAVSVGSTKVPLVQGFNMVGSLNVSGDLTLEGLNLRASGFASGSNPSAGDRVIAVSPSGSATIYWHSTNVAFPGWRNTAFADASAVTFAPGSAFFVECKNPGGYNWSLPLN